jgi:hypothetical protein
MNRRKIFLLICVIGLQIIACHKVKKQASSIVVVAVDKLAQQKEKAVDKIIPQFDAYKADSKFNKERFKEFIQIEQGSDIKNIYCYADNIGIDASFQFAFSCDSTSAQKIIDKHHLVAATKASLDSYGLQKEFDWWKITRIKSLPLYTHEDEHQYYQYFWYDKANKQGYYLDFDM